MFTAPVWLLAKLPGAWSSRRMSEQEFLAALTGHDSDLKLAVAALRATGQPFCLIGGLAVNHYVEPVVTLDADFAIGFATGVADALRASGFIVEEFSHSINAQLSGSRLRIQITADSRYGAFPARAVEGELFGVRLPIAALEDLVEGKLWAFTDRTRRASKRAKDRADLIRICETCPQAINLIEPVLMETTVLAGLNLAVVYGFSLIIVALVMALIYNRACGRKEASLKTGGAKGTKP